MNGGKVVQNTVPNGLNKKLEQKQHAEKENTTQALY
jgi:hypothetical protein